jgi:hypothetical protein
VQQFPQECQRAGEQSSFLEDYDGQDHPEDPAEDVGLACSQCS